MNKATFEKVTFRTKDGNTHVVTEQGNGKILIESFWARSLAEDRYITKGDIYSLIVYVTEKHGAEILKREVVEA